MIAWAAYPSSSYTRRRRSSAVRYRRGVVRQAHAERRSSPQRALDIDLATVRLDNALDDRESEASAAGCAVRLPESIEN